MEFKNRVLLIQLGLTSLFCFLYSYFAIDLRLHFNYQQIAFHTDSMFFMGFVDYAGGLGEYLAVFVSQFFYSKFLGSLIVSIFGVLISSALYSILKTKLTKQPLFLISIALPQIIQLVLLTNYRYHFSISVNILLLLLAVLLAVTFLKRLGKFQGVAVFVLALAIYYVSGGMYLLLFAASVVLMQSNTDDGVVGNIAAAVLSALLLPFLAYKFVFVESLSDSFFKATPDLTVMLTYKRPILFYVFLAYFPAIVLLSRVLALFNFETSKKKKQTKKQKAKDAALLQEKRKKTMQLAMLSAEVLGFILIAFLFVNSTDFETEKLEQEVDLAAYQQNWDNVIELAETPHEYNRLINFNYNRALAHKGLFLEKMFDCEQLLGIQALIMVKPFGGEITIPSSDLYFDLGNINGSQHYAFEAQTLIYYSPRVLKRIIENSIIMGEFGTANTYLNVLENNPLEKEWVEKHRDFVTNPEQAAKDKLIAQKRRQKTDMNATEKRKLLNLMEKDSTNRFAFEYLIAYDLMEHELGSFVKRLKHLKSLGYKKTPRIVEQAILMLRATHPEIKGTENIKISDVAYQEFMTFSKIMQKYNRNRAMFKQMSANFKNTYYYYVLFDSPKVTNLKMDIRKPAQH